MSQSLGNVISKPATVNMDRLHMPAMLMMDRHDNIERKKKAGRKYKERCNFLKYGISDF